eukprot:s3413_g8.t1
MFAANTMPSPPQEVPAANPATDRSVPKSPEESGAESSVNAKEAVSVEPLKNSPEQSSTAIIPPSQDPKESQNTSQTPFTSEETFNPAVQNVSRDPSEESGDIEQHGERFRALPKEEQAMLKRAHKNLCHPNAEQLSAVLRSQGCRPELSQAVFDMKCPTCASSQKPKISRPSTLKCELDFNDKIFIDGITWTSKQGQNFHFYHLLDQATNFHVAIPAPSRTAEQAIQKTTEAWLQWAGPPNMLVSDPATEFTSDLYQEFLQKHDIKGITTSPNADWQNGRCERHGEILQAMLTKIDLEQPITTYLEFQQALVQSTHAKNTLSIRRGYSPEILVFGKSSKIPGSVVSSEDLAAHESANRDDAQGIHFRRHLALREKARMAFHQADNDQALRRACLRRSRPDRQAYSPGEWIMLWQPQKTGNGYWFGPAKEQPDDEPEEENPESNMPENMINNPIDTPVPEIDSDDSLMTSHLLCVDDEVLTVDPIETPCAWRFELELPSSLSDAKATQMTADEILLATTDKKQRTEVRLSTLTSEEQQAFKRAKESEVQNWIKTGTVSKILRNKLAPEQILRCRWILVWKPLDENPEKADQENIRSEKLKTHKPKARLVVLGYLDPNLTEIPRDSPTLGRQSKMLLLQLISSKGWRLGSFDIRAAFLQGRTQKDRVMGIEPVPELAQALQLKPEEVCKLDKSAYGLVDAPFLWFKTLSEELMALGMQPSPFDPCLFLLRDPKTNELAGALGVHVDDGIHGGNQFFHDQIAKLEKKYPFGSKKSQSFTFTGIDLFQHPDNSIELSQTKYVNNIPSIQISADRRKQEEEPVTEAERHHLRGLVGSLQYAAEFRTQLLARSIKDILSEGIRLHWVHSGAQLADALTKIMEANFLRATLREGRYCLHDSDEVLKKSSFSPKSPEVAQVEQRH